MSLLQMKQAINAKLSRIVKEHCDEFDGNSYILYMRSTEHDGIVKNYGKMTDVIAAYQTTHYLSFLISSENDDEQTFVGLWELESGARRKVYDYICSFDK